MRSFVRANAHTHAAVALALAILVVASVGAPASGETGVDERSVGSCTTVDRPGTYVLERDLVGDEGACIVVTASDVTVDGDGHAVDAGSGTGVAVGGTGETVENVTVEDLRIDGGRDGLAATGTENLRVSGVTATGQSRDAVAVTDASHVAVAGVVVRGAGRYGVYVDADGRTTVENTSVAGTRHEAIELLGGADAVLDGVAVRNVRGDEFDEPYDAVFVNVDGDVSIRDAVVRNVPEGRGVYVYASTGDGRVHLDGVSVGGTRGHGLRLGSYGGTELTVTGTTVTDAGGSALWANAFGTVTLRASTFRSAGRNVLEVVAADAVRVVDVRTCGGAVELGGAERTVEGLDRTCPTVAAYAGDDGVVDTTALQRAITDWATGEIGIDLLTRVIEAWATGTAVVGVSPVT